MLDKNILKAVFVTIMLIVSIYPMVLADWTPGDGHKMHYPQLPDEEGWAVYATAGLDDYGYPEICLADDWLCTETGNVTDIHFWGAWKGGIEGNILAFVIAIAADIPASQNPDGYSKPGETLWERTFEFWDAVAIDPPSSEGWYDPYWEEVIYDDHVPYFQYNIENITNPFYQEVDTIYWLSISAIVEYDPSGLQPLWGWKSTENHWNDDAVWAEWWVLDWIDLWEPAKPVINQYWIAIDPMWNLDPILTGGTDYYHETGEHINGWYYYPQTDWWNIWFYDHEFNESRIKKIFTSFELSKYDIQQPSYVEVAINWATDYWEPGGPPPIPPIENEELYIGRAILLEGYDMEGWFEFFYEILDYNPEWVSIDVRGYNFVIRNGIIEHACLQSLDLAFVITGEETPPPSIEIDKTVWDNNLQTWVDYIEAEVCTILRFNLTIHNNGQVPLIVTKVQDILPDCLEYEDSATVNGDPREPDIAMPPNYEWHYPIPPDYWYPGSEPGELPSDEWIYIEFDVHVVSSGENINEACVEAQSDGEPVTDCDTATVIGIGIPSIEINKWVWDNTHQEWIELIYATVGSTVSFKIDIHNDGDFDLTNIVVTDTLPICLDYVDGSAVPPPTNVNGKTITWVFSGPLPYCETITITFDAEVVSEGENINYVEVSANSDGGAVFDADTATVIGVSAGMPSVEIDKWIWDEHKQEWVKQMGAWFCTEVMFRIDIHNNGDIPIYEIIVTDLLPYCLEFLGSEPPPYYWDPMMIQWVFPILEPCQTIEIYLWVHVIDIGPNPNEVWIDAWSDMGPVSDSDVAIIYAFPPGEDIIPPEIVELNLVSSNPIDVNPSFGWENISAIVTDVGGVGVAEVKLIVTNPDDNITEYPMTNMVGTDTYYVNTTFTIEGCYEYYVWTDDFNENYAESSSMNFELPPNEDVDNNGHIYFMDLVKVVLKYNEYGPNGWVREDVDNNGHVYFMDLVKIVLRYNEHWEQCL